MITYLIRQDSDIQFTVSKWNMGVVPIEVYTVTLGNRAKCNCPGNHNHGYCKHTGMVKDWVKRGKPMEEIVA